MPDSKGQPLPPLEEQEGYIEKTELKSNRCSHKNTELVSGIELRCTCGAGWTGPEVRELQKLFNQG